MKLDIPLPLPDEIVYSAIARGIRRLGISSERVRITLFDGRQIIPRPHFCSQLDIVASALSEKASWPFTPGELRDRHTLAPLALPLVPAHIRPRCEAAVHRAHFSRNFHGRCRNVLGIHARTRLRSCETCRTQDLMRYGEQYIHRIHQIPAVRVCPHHQEWLEECDLTAEPNVYVPLDDIQEFTDISTSEADFPAQLRLAKTLWRLLSNSHSDSFELLSLRDELAAGDQLPGRIRYRNDCEWMNVARLVLPLIVPRLKQRYRCPIKFATLKKALEQSCETRLPPRFRIPETTAFLKSYVESRAEWAQRADRLKAAVHEPGDHAFVA